MLVEKTLDKMRPKVSAIADALGVHRRTLNYWMKGERSPSPENARELAELADQQADELISLARRLRHHANQREEAPDAA
jgi:plasmid maintenance system antidote protein VapI